MQKPIDQPSFFFEVIIYAMAIIAAIIILASRGAPLIWLLEKIIR